MPRILVVDPIGLVAEDLADCIAEIQPGSEIIVSIDLAEGLDWLNVSAAAGAFVSTDILRNAPPQHLQALTDRGGRLVAFGSRVPDMLHLDSPFTPGDVAQVLADIGGR